jgi:long-chain fatty acid transport protein
MKIRTAILLCSTLALLAPASLFASGFGYYEQGAKATAMAGAFVGRADDVTAVFYNPAGIAFLDGTNFHFGTHPIKMDFTAKFMGISTDGVNDWLTPASIFFSTKLAKDIYFGFGFYVPFGLTVDWPKSWIGNQISYHTAVRSYYVQPTLAYKINDQFSLGVGLNIVRGKVELSQNNVQSVTLSPYLPPLEVPIDTVVEATGNGYGVNLGFLYKAAPNFSFGVSYKSEIEIDYDGDVDFTPTSTGIAAVDATIGAVFSDQNIRTTIAMPQILAFGTMFEVNPDFGLQVDLQWTGWSSFKNLVFDFDNDLLDSTDVNNWEDTWTFRVGCEYRPALEWALRAGYIYDQATIPLATLKPLLPDSSRNEVTFGLGYDTKETCCWGRLGLDFAVQYIWAAARTSTFAHFPADYESNVLILGTGISLSF